MSKSEEIKTKLKIQRDEIISEIKQLIMRERAEEVSLFRELIWQYIDDQFSATIYKVSQKGIVVTNPYYGEDDFIPFENEEIEMGHLISILDELEKGRFDIEEELEEK